MDFFGAAISVRLAIYSSLFLATFSNPHPRHQHHNYRWHNTLRSCLSSIRCTITNNPTPRPIININREENRSKTNAVASHFWTRGGDRNGDPATNIKRTDDHLNDSFFCWMWSLLLSSFQIVCRVKRKRHFAGHYSTKIFKTPTRWNGEQQACKKRREEREGISGEKHQQNHKIKISAKNI